MARKELSPGARDRICELSTLGYGAARIHTMHPEWPTPTIKSTIRREASRAANHSRPRSGRPRALTEEQRDRVYDLTNHVGGLRMKMRDLLREVDGACEKRSLQSLLREMNDGKSAAATTTTTKKSEDGKRSHQERETSVPPPEPPRRIRPKITKERTKGGIHPCRRSRRNAGLPPEISHT